MGEQMRDVLAEIGQRKILYSDPGIDITDEVLSAPLSLAVIGPPRTAIAFAPEVSEFSGGYYIMPNTRITLQATTEDEDGIQAVFFDVDVVDPPRPTMVYTGEITLADLGPEFAAPGKHELRFYAEESSGIVEAVRTVTLFTARDLASDKQITNRPNPFRAGQEETIILFRPTVSGTVTISLYDLYGGLVYSEQMQVSAGNQEQFRWPGVNGTGRVVANGGYICRIHGPGMDLRRKIAVVK